MIRNPIDIASRVSPELSSLIEGIINQLETGEPVTLGLIREFIIQDLPEEFSETELMHRFDVSESVMDELDALIEEFGESAAAVEFIYVFASEPLSRVIETVVNDANRDTLPTLADVEEALIDGLASRLVGEGVLEEDEDDLLIAEIGELVGRFGADAPAEQFLRYE